MNSLAICEKYEFWLRYRFNGVSNSTTCDIEKQRKQP